MLQVSRCTVSVVQHAMLQWSSRQCYSGPAGNVTVVQQATLQCLAGNNTVLQQANVTGVQMYCYRGQADKCFRCPDVLLQWSSRQCYRCPDVLLQWSSRQILQLSSRQCYSGPAGNVTVVQQATLQCLAGNNTVLQQANVTGVQIYCYSGQAGKCFRCPDVLLQWSSRHVTGVQMYCYSGLAGKFYSCPASNVTVVQQAMLQVSRCTVSVVQQAMLQWSSRQCYSCPAGNVTGVQMYCYSGPAGKCYNCPAGTVTVAQQAMLQWSSRQCYSGPDVLL